MSSPKVWLITGCSSGFGHEMTLAALSRGDKVIATARDPKKISNLAEAGADTLLLDVTSGDTALAAVAEAAYKIHGRIDILVNNAGYLLQGAVEECSAEESFNVFNTNVFGPLAVIRAFLPGMRAARSGVIANLGSIAGVRGTPSAGLYCATKFAVIGFTESLKLELAHLGINVVCIEPGYFRTNFLNASGAKDKAGKEIDDYKEVTRPIDEALEAYDRRQINDPVKGAKCIVEALTGTGEFEGRGLPIRLALGKDSVEFAEETLGIRRKDVNGYKDLVSDLACED